MAMADLSQTTMKLYSSLHRRLNVEIVLITVLHKNMKQGREHQVASSDVMVLTHKQFTRQ